VTTIRFFAGARAAVGVAETTVSESTLGAALDAVARRDDLADAGRWQELAPRCSYLVDGVTTRDRTTPLVGVARVDVMPPFAGG
jgi:molybdopterin synthase sulfur carrier subunit